MDEPIEIDRSKKRKMDNGLCCKDVTEQDISDCMIRHPYSAGQGTWGDRCQTSVIATIANCCLKTNWDPNSYAGPRRGRCLNPLTITLGLHQTMTICLELEYPKWWGL